MTPRVRLQGSRDAQSAYASINRRWAALLASRPELTLIGEDDGGEADVVIHHDFASRFGADPARGRRRAAVRPWDFGPYPPRWADVLQTHYNELWVHSAWTERSAAAAGVPPERIRRIPLGIDTGVLRPDGPVQAVAPDDHFVFLFVGAAVRRKGIDILIDAFTRAFRTEDPVTLVVKDHTGDVFYAQQSYRDRILEAAARTGAPRIVYLDAYLPLAELAALYRRADAFVLPYRAEGFACPVLEAMACGTPPIVPAFGACRDYCSEDSAVLVPVREIRLPIMRTMATNALGFEERVDAVHFCEIAPDRLADTLRDAARRPAGEWRALGAAAAARAQAWTWAASADAVVRGVLELART